MVSGVSFKNPNHRSADVKKKQAISSGLFFGVALMVLVGTSYLGALFYGKAQDNKAQELDQEILTNKQRIDAELEGNAADLYAKSQAVQQIGQVEKTTSALLAIDFQPSMVRGIVFQAFSQTYDYETGENVVEITADGPSYDVIAAQINVWKTTPAFQDIRVTSIARDEESQFIVFTAEVVIAPSEGQGPYGPEFTAGNRNTPAVSAQ